MRSVRRLAAVVGSAALLAACTASPTRSSVDLSGLPVSRPVRQSDLLPRPQARLYFPGSTVEERTGSDQTANPHSEEPDPAYVATVLSAHTTPGRLMAWYADTLSAEGFSPARYYLASNQSTGAAWAYHRRLQVQVAVSRTPAPSAAGLTYEVFLVGYAPGLPRY